MKKIMLISVTILFFYSCDNYYVSYEKYYNVKTENEKLKKELKELNDSKFSASKLLIEANEKYNNNKFKEAKNDLLLLIEKHPESNEAIEANIILKKIDSSLFEIDKILEKQNLDNEKKEKERIASVLKNLKTKIDDIENITWYYDINKPNYYTNYIYLYIGKKENDIWLRLKVQYKADSWLFINKFIVKTENETYEFLVDRADLKTDASGDGIAEWFDKDIDFKIYNMINSIINSKNAKIRFNGEKYYDDRIISNKEKQGLQNILDAYKALGGKLNY